MTLRCIPCPVCHRAPTTVQLEDGQSATYCKTKGCTNALYCLGSTEDRAKKCWNDRIEKEGDE